MGRSSSQFDAGRRQQASGASVVMDLLILPLRRAVAPLPPPDAKHTVPALASGRAPR
jgi:hypothetical protein